MEKVERNKIYTLNRKNIKMLLLLSNIVWWVPGKYFFKSGNIYEGEWKDNTMNGKGNNITQGYFVW